MSELQSFTPDVRTRPSPHGRKPSRPGRLGAPGPGRASTSSTSRPRHRDGPGRGLDHAPGHRRCRAGPRLILAQATGVFSQGHLSANCRTAVPTRAHQSGGQPTSPAPAHGRALTRSPPLPGGQGVAAASPGHAPGKPPFRLLGFEGTPALLVRTRKGAPQAQRCST